MSSFHSSISAGLGVSTLPRIRALFVCAVMYATTCAIQANPFAPPKAPPPVKKTPPPPKAKPKPTPKTKVNLELRGIMFWDDMWYFSIHDLSDRESYWITEENGEEGPEAPFGIKNWNQKDSILTLTNGIELSLKEPSGKSIPIAGRPAAKPSSNKVTPPRSNPGKKIPSPTIVRGSSNKTNTNTRVPPPRVSPRTR